jgi:hypothetical protein
VVLVLDLFDGLGVGVLGLSVFAGIRTSLMSSHVVLGDVFGLLLGVLAVLGGLGLRGRTVVLRIIVFRTVVFGSFLFGSVLFGLRGVGGFGL